jgi:hypothetical protein
MSRHLGLFAVSLVAINGAWAALAGGATAAGSSSSAATPKTTQSAARSTIRLTLPNAFIVHGDVVTVARHRLEIAGVVRPYVAGQWVMVKTFLGHRRLKLDRLRIRPSGNQRLGRFTEWVRSPGAGIVRIRVTHAPTAQMAGASAQRAVAALDQWAGFGARGSLVSLIQQRLATLHIYVPQSDVYDQRTGLALDAYHRLLGWGVSQRLDRPTIDALLDGRSAFHIRFPSDGTHVEVDLSKQLLALAYGARVYRIYPISSGKPSTPTVLGRYRVYSRTPGYLPDGMYYSSFFYRGYAIHGYDPAPDYPASHGCVRLPISDAISVYDWVTYGDVVDVYR